MNAATALLACLITTAGAAEVQPRLDLGIALRGTDDGIVEQGEPLRIALHVAADDGVLLLAPAAGSWTGALSVELLRSDSRAVAARAVAVGAAETSTLKLDSDHVVASMWRVGADSMRSVSPGNYLLQARLAIPAAAAGSGGWVGELLSEELPLQVLAPSTDPPRVAQRTIALAADAMLEDRLEEAAAIVDPLLTEQPDNVEAWALRSAISERAGNIPGAVLAINRAQEYSGDIDLDLEMSMQRLALAQRNAGKQDAAPLPDWTWPPGTFDGPLPPAVENPPVIPASAIPAAAQSAPPSAGTVVTVASVPASGGTEILTVAVADEGVFLSDSAGQWAAMATASSEYAPDRYNAMQATGAPDVEDYSDNANAWCHSSTSNSEDWLELTYAQPVVATELRVRQNYTPGTIAKVEAFAADGRALLLWEGTDPNVYADRQISWFVLRTEPTPFPVNRIRLTLNIPAIGGWKQIDAVQLVGSAPVDER